jgi:hypothetical protein
MYLAALSDGLKDTAKLHSDFAFELLTFSGRYRLAFDCNSVRRLESRDTISGSRQRRRY